MSATMQLSAVVYYLKQNLLQFSYIPNYADSRLESHFQASLYTQAFCPHKQNQHTGNSNTAPWSFKDVYQHLTLYISGKLSYRICHSNSCIHRWVSAMDDL
jgi:hypothetical protein